MVDVRYVILAALAIAAFAVGMTRPSWRESVLLAVAVGMLAYAVMFGVV